MVSTNALTKSAQSVVELESADSEVYPSVVDGSAFGFGVLFARPFVALAGDDFEVAVVDLALLVVVFLVFVVFGAATPSLLGSAFLRALPGFFDAPEVLEVVVFFRRGAADSFAASAPLALVVFRGARAVFFAVDEGSLGADAVGLAVSTVAGSDESLGGVFTVFLVAAAFFGAVVALAAVVFFEAGALAAAVFRRVRVGLVSDSAFVSEVPAVEASDFAVDSGLFRLRVAVFFVASDAAFFRVGVRFVAGAFDVSAATDEVSSVACAVVRPPFGCADVAVFLRFLAGLVGVSFPVFVSC